jgi:hypothetical protein
MQRNTAEKIISTFQDFMRQIDDSIRVVMNDSPDEDFVRYRRTAGKIMGEIFLEILQPLYGEHPHLIPDQLRKPHESGSEK